MFAVSSLFSCLAYHMNLFALCTFCLSMVWTLLYLICWYCFVCPIRFNIKGLNLSLWCMYLLWYHTIWHIPAGPPTTCPNGPDIRQRLVAPLYCASPRSLHLALSHLRALSRGLTRRGHKGTEVESRNSSIVSLTLTLDWGGGSMPCPGHFTPGNALTTTVEEAGSGQCTKPCPHWQSLHEQ